MEETDFYVVIANAVAQKEAENRYKGNGHTTIKYDGDEYSVSYEIMELEDYEEACYDVESSRCGPGGYFGLDTYVFENLLVTNTTDDENDIDVDIDLRELSYVYNEDCNGNILFDKMIYIDQYYDNR